jgi:Fe-S-cluster containining protein
MSDTPQHDQDSPQVTGIHHPRPALALPDTARQLHSRVVKILRDLEQKAPASPLDPAFTKVYFEMLGLFEQFQKEVVAHSGLTVACGKGCRTCCFHWVEDVYSFEAELIADHIRRHLPDRIERIISVCREDEGQLEIMDDVVTAKLAEVADEAEAEEIDQVDLLLASFYQLRRPCILLNDDGACGIYPVRPLTCRIYMSFSDPSYCDPSYINDADVRTYLCDLEEEASEILDRLHERYDRFDGDMGLRSLLYKHLSERQT